MIVKQYKSDRAEESPGVRRFVLETKLREAPGTNWTHGATGIFALIDRDGWRSWIC